MADYTDFLNPTVISRLSNLELIARLIVEGTIIGMHKSPYHGFNVEFASYRTYSPGDDFRFVDWKVFARSDKFYVKQFEENTNMSAFLLLDASNSMAYADAPLSKLAYASYLTASLAHLMLGQRDAVSLTIFNEKEETFVPPSTSSIHMQHVISALRELAPSKGTDLIAGLRSTVERIKRRGVVVLVSDLLEPPENILENLKILRYNQSEVIIFHILTDSERTFPFKDATRFVDLETGEEIKTQSSYIRDGYLAGLNAHIDEIKRGCAEMMIDFVELTTSDLFSKPLVAYLAKRKMREGLR